MAKKQRELPPWVDPATGLRYQEENRPVPGYDKPAWALTPDEFIAFVAVATGEVSNWFYRTGWPEGLHYCPGNDRYTRFTAHHGYVLHALVRGEAVPDHVVDCHPGILAKIRHYHPEAKCLKENNGTR